MYEKALQIRWFIAIGACALVPACLIDKIGDDCAERSMCPRDAGDDATGGGSQTDGGSAGGATSGGTPGGTGGTMSTTGSGGMTGSGGVADGGAGGMGLECDTSASPSDEPCLVSDEFAVFVAPDGDDDDDGTMSEPVATFARALELADSDGKIVIACAGEYDEQVVIDDEVHIYGGFDCDDDWSYAPGEPSTVAPSTRGYALRIDGVDGEVAIEDVAFIAQDGASAGQSSIAGFVSESSDVALRRVVLEAGEGVAGESAENPGFAPFPTVEMLQGVDGDVTSGGVKDSCTCPGGATSTGGNGGDPDEDGDDGLPDHAGDGGEGGNAAETCTGGGGLGSGQPGTAGPSPTDADGASTLGTLTAAGFTASPRHKRLSRPSRPGRRRRRWKNRGRWW
ncbi:MAG TPA: hypothetical protein VF989_00635 [Polyangiaceae bacterium]